MGIFDRTGLIVGHDNLQKLFNKKVIVFGIGGVGGYVCECLARTGIGEITLVDFDIVSETNINRQIIALHSTLNQFKVDVMKKRILDINPNCKVKIFKEKFCEETKDIFSLQNYDYVADCIDSFKDKLLLIKECKNLNINIICAMGAGNKFGIPKFTVMDIFQTKYDGLAKKLRKALREENISNLNVVCAENSEDMISLHSTMQNKTDSEIEAKTIGSIAFFPSMAGLVISSKIIKDLIN